MGDYHVHLHPHGPYDGTGPEPGTYPAAHIEAYVETALSRGVDEVGFTEHLYRCTEAEELLGTFWGERTAVGSRGSHRPQRRDRADAFA